MKIFTCLAVALLSALTAIAQEEDLLSMLGDDENAPSLTTAAFKTTRIVNGHSIENVAKGVLDVKISHRFGKVNNGVKDLFGLDNATIRMGGDYGITDRLMVGFGRSSYEKTYDGYLKYRILRQHEGKKAMPLSISYVPSIAVTTADFTNPDRENYTRSKFFYGHQLLIARKFSDKFSFQLMPTLVHRNLVKTKDEENDVISIGAGLRQKISQRVTVNLEYFYVLPDQVAEQFTNTFSVGFDIETGGHVFQMHFTSSPSMISKGYVAENTDDFFDGDIRFGFNISRVFTVRKPKDFR